MVDRVSHPRDPTRLPYFQMDAFELPKLRLGHHQEEVKDIFVQISN